MHILICDDDARHSESVLASIERWKQRGGSANIAVERFRSPGAALLFLKGREAFDLAFLEAQFPGEMDGLQLARELRLRNPRTEIVFITGREEYAPRGYEVGALRFLRKPADEEQIRACLDIACRSWRDAQSEASIAVERRQVIYRIPCSMIRYIESAAPYLDIHTDGPQPQKLHIRRKLSDISGALPPGMFVQCHQSFLVNPRYVHRVSKQNIVLLDGTEIPVSAKCRESTYARFKALLLAETRDP